VLLLSLPAFWTRASSDATRKHVKSKYKNTLKNLTPGETPGEILVENITPGETPGHQNSEFNRPGETPGHQNSEFNRPGETPGHQNSEFNRHTQDSTVYMNEYGVIALVMKSRLPSAETFQDWIIEEVIPSIRKTGQYQNHDLINRVKLLKMSIGFKSSIIFIGCRLVNILIGYINISCMMGSVFHTKIIDIAIIIIYIITLLFIIYYSRILKNYIYKTTLTRIYML
jgi:hypothetical protein